MQTVPIQSIPNQEFTITLEGNLYDITLRTIQGATYATIYMNGVLLISGTRCVSGYPILPYQYLEDDGGNFAFITLNGTCPTYSQFNITQSLVYATVAELAAERAT